MTTLAFLFQLRPSKLRFSLTSILLFSALVGLGLGWLLSTLNTRHRDFEATMATSTLVNARTASNIFEAMPVGSQLSGFHKQMLMANLYGLWQVSVLDIDSAHLYHDLSTKFVDAEAKRILDLLQVNTGEAKKLVLLYKGHPIESNVIASDGQHLRGEFGEWIVRLWETR